MDPERKNRKSRFSANTKLILRRMCLKERSLTCTQSTITPGVHLTFKIAGLKKFAVSKVLENLDKPDKEKNNCFNELPDCCDKSV